MKAKELAEMMISGDLGYKPENDAYRIATKYIELADATEKIIKDHSLEHRIKATLIMEEDRARPLTDDSNRKEIDLGGGLRLTESEDMGIFLHFKTKEGNCTGQSLSIGTAGYRWAVELLEDVDPDESPELFPGTLKALDNLRV